MLRALTGPPSEPLEGVDMKCVSLKTALLLALTSAKRVGDMQALSISPSCLQFSIAGDKVVMRPNAAYTPKVVVMNDSRKNEPDSHDMDPYAC